MFPLLSQMTRGGFVGMVAARDPDHLEPLTYRLITSSNELFFIHSLHGIIYLAVSSASQLSTADDYQLVVMVTDGAHVAQTNVTIRVLATDRFAPRFVAQPTMTARLMENAAAGGEVALVTARDQVGTLNLSIFLTHRTLTG